MSSPWGVQPTGFVRKPLSAIIQSFNDGVQQIPGYAQADVSPTSPLGKLHSLVYGAALDEVWGLLQTSYNAFNRTLAFGAQADNLGAISGSLRLPPKPSSVMCTCVFTASGTYPAGTLIANVVGQPTSQFANFLDVVVPVMSPPLSSANPLTMTNLLFASVEDGPIAGPAGQLTQISAAVSGWLSITNPLDAQLGNLLEQDPAYTLRQVEEIAAVGATQAQALEAVLLEIPHVIAVRVLENTGLSPDPVTSMPPKSFQVLIYADNTVDWTKVSQTIWNEKPAGMLAYGTTWPGIAPTPFVQIDAEGNDVSASVQWTPITPVDISLLVQVTFVNGLTNAQKTAVASAVATNIANLSQGFDPSGNSLPIGTQGILIPGGSPGLLPGPPATWVQSGFVYMLPYVRAALQTPGILDVTNCSFIGTGPVATVQPPNITTIAISQIAVISTATGRLVVSDPGGVWHN